METKRILVTGGAGFIGSWIAKSLIDKGHNVYIADDLSGGDEENISSFKERLSGFYNVDLSNTISTMSTIDNIRPEIIYHLAANAREGASYFDPLKITKTNYYAYINMLESAIKTGQLNKVILFSSMAVYGNQDSPFYETMERRPVDIYGINKSAMEHTTEILSKVHNFRYTIIRPHNVFGPKQSLCDPYRNVIGIWMNRIIRKEPIYIYGDGRQKRAFSYIEDSLDCYIRCIENGVDNEIINIGGMKPISINTLAEIVCNKMGVGMSYPIEHLPERFGEVKNAFCSYEKSRILLGYEEKIGWEKGVEIMSKWSQKKGKQKWKEDKLSLWNEKALNIWK